jgi:hypothetical protein
MITAIGTAVILETENKNDTKHKKIAEKISVDEISDLRKKKSIITKAKSNELNLNDETWNFITANQITEILPYLLNKLSSLLDSNPPESTVDDFTEKLKIYIDHLPDDLRREELYSFLITSNNNKSTSIVTTIIEELFLLDFDKTNKLITNDDISKKKIGLNIATLDKSHYDVNDIESLKSIKNSIELSFKERGEITTKKQLLSSKEKEIWVCECGKTNNLESKYCSSCEHDIYGFKSLELKPTEAIEYLENKIKLLSELTS